MISRKGTRRSGAASGDAKIFREEGSGPVVTAGSVVSGLERMFMGSSVLILVCTNADLVILRCAHLRASKDERAGPSPFEGR